MLIRINKMRRQLRAALGLMLFWAMIVPIGVSFAQAPAASSQPITAADLKNLKGPSADDLAKGDPGARSRAQ